MIVKKTTFPPTTVAIKTGTMQFVIDTIHDFHNDACALGKRKFTFNNSISTLKMNYSELQFDNHEFEGNVRESRRRVFKLKLWDWFWLYSCEFLSWEMVKIWIILTWKENLHARWQESDKKLTAKLTCPAGAFMKWIDCGFNNVIDLFKWHNAWDKMLTMESGTKLVRKPTDISWNVYQHKSFKRSFQSQINVYLSFASFHVYF